MDRFFRGGSGRAKLHGVGFHPMMVLT
jgi:hypothetical protein